MVSSLNDLKEKVARLVLLVLVIEFFQRALSLQYERALDLLFFAGGVLLVSAALYLSGLNASPKKPAAQNTSGPTRQEAPPGP